MACSIRTELFCLTLLLSGLTSAATPSPEAAARAAAHQAKQAFDLGDFRRAIEQYQTAYKLKPAPGLLFNLGQSHRRGGDLEKAAFYFRRYLESNPPGAQAKATEELLAQVQAQLEAKKAAEAARLQLEDQRRQGETEHERQMRLEQARLATARAETDATERKLALEASLKQQPLPPPPVYQRWWFWSAVGVVVAGAAVTATVVATAPQPTLTTFPDINAR